jgi:nucleotide-binding universal stress UspA family protein
MRKILIATDGSETGRAAVEAGVELAADEGASVVLVHVISILDFAEDENGSSPPLPQRLPRDEDDPALRDGLGVAAQQGVEATAELLVGYPPKQIVRLASDAGVDLIVVGSRGLGRVKSAFLGSTSREVLAHAGRPVLVVKPVAVRESAPG